MKLKGLGKLFAILYNDRMDIYRTSSTINGDYTTDVSYEAKPLYSDISCRISFSSDDTGADSDVDRNPVKFDPKLFCHTNVDIRAGDYVVVRRYEDDGSVLATYEGIVAMPSAYSTHKETFIRVNEGA